MSDQETTRTAELELWKFFVLVAVGVSSMVFVISQMDGAEVVILV